MRLGMVIDLKRCIGCQTCMISCKVSNRVPQGMFWNRVESTAEDCYDGAVGSWPYLSRTYTPIACQHCENPACERVCPTGATYVDDEGRVEIDYDRCIGCRMCMAACPYNARQFNWSDPAYDPEFAYGRSDVPVRPQGVAEKCTLCRERTAQGGQPMCVSTCLGHVRVFGDLDDPDSEVSRLLAANNAVQLLPEMGTNPHVYYLM